MSPIVDCASGLIIGAINNALMFAQDLPFGGDYDPRWIDPNADRSIGEGCWHAVTIALQVDQANLRDPLCVFDEPVELPWRRYQVRDFSRPDVGDGSGQHPMGDLRPLPIPPPQPARGKFNMGQISVKITDL